MNICISSQAANENMHWTLAAKASKCSNMSGKEKKHPTLTGFYNKAESFLRSRLPDKIQKELEEKTGVEQSRISKFKNNKAGLGVDAYMALLEHYGAEIILPEEGGGNQPPLAREVCFADPVIKGVQPYADFETRLKPQADDYLAVPLVKEVGAGHGLIEEAKITDWIVVYAHSLPRATTPALCAVRVGQNQRSMMPLLQPGDLVLVDKGRYEPTDDGKIWMVRDPEDGGEMIKRVATTNRDGDLELIFYSDNVPEYRPETWRLKRDFGGDIKNAIVGRVIWAWTDVTKK